MTLRQLLARARAYLKTKGVDSPGLSAELCAAKALGLERLQLFLAPDRRIGRDERLAMARLVARRGRGEPAAYLLGEKEFYGLSFKVTPATLIPRPESEGLIEAALALLPGLAPGGAVRFVDFGTGSGVLAVTFAKLAPRARGLALDVSRAALAVARENAGVHGVENRVCFALADFGQAPCADRSLDLILANPPYVSCTEYAQVSREVRDYEPRGALVPGPRQARPGREGGTEAALAALCSAGRALRPGGFLLMEIGHTQGRELLAALAHNHAWAEARLLRDLAGLDRILLARA